MTGLPGTVPEQIARSGAAPLGPAAVVLEREPGLDAALGPAPPVPRASARATASVTAAMPATAGRCRPRGPSRLVPGGRTLPVPAACAASSCGAERESATALVKMV